MTGRESGQLISALFAAVVLTLPVGAIALALYRAAILRGMREAAGPVGALQEARPSQHLVVGAADPAPQLRRRAAIVLTAGALSASAVFFLDFVRSWDESLRAVQLLAIAWGFGWAVVPTLALGLDLGRRRAIALAAGYLLVGMMTIVLFTAARGRPPGDWVANAWFLASFVSLNAAVPLAIALLASPRRTRAIAPMVLAALLVFSFANLTAVRLLVIGFDPAGTGGSLLGALGAEGFFAAWHMLLAIPVGAICWWGLCKLADFYRRKAFSDVQLLLDAWWVIFCLCLAVRAMIGAGWSGLLVALFAFVAWRGVVTLGFALWRLPPEAARNDRLLLLRVFGFDRRTEALFDAVAQRWRWHGNVWLIAGTDLARRIIGPGDLIAFLGGRLRQLFLTPDPASLAAIDALDQGRDPDGRYRVQPLYCHDNGWRQALLGLLGKSDRVLMDLRGFGVNNQGCRFELEAIAKAGLLPRTVFITDRATDTALLMDTLQAIRPDDAGRAEFVAIESGRASETARLLGAFRRAGG